MIQQVPSDKSNRRKISNKKNKTWEGDGVLAVHNGMGTLTDEAGKDIGRTRCSGPLLPDTMLCISGKEVQVESLMKKEDYLAGKKFLGSAVKPSSVNELDDKLRTGVSFKSLSKPSNEQAKKVARPEKPLAKTVPTSTKSTHSSFKSPVVDSTVMPTQTDTKKPTPRHDPDAPNAIVMKRIATPPKGKQLVDVVVDPILSKNLREHQREGVKFMYECVMGMRPYNGDGAILADEMGLGKTLQVIALLWTLLKQNPIADDSPVIKKALIVCPVTLIKNWKKEFRKWLGNERIGVFTYEDNKARLTDFTKGKSYSVMIVGYERLQSISTELQKGLPIDIIICDEGHRLKTAKNKSAQAIKALSTTRKIILSGTPLQNDLSEFYFMVDFVNPGLLGKLNTFKKEFETPILKSRVPDASEMDIEKGSARSEELSKLTAHFIIRRTAEILSKYLPPKTEYVLFCKPTAIQAQVYRNVLSTPEFGAVLNSPETSLQLISILKKICNSPKLLIKAADDKEAEEGTSNTLISSILHSVPQKLIKAPGASGKLQVLDSLLHRLRTTTSEKVVIVSHYTATLDILGNLVTSLGYNFLRLDGSTAQSKRQELVDRFNRTDANACFAFLLSAKSGGVGLNLTGASRLVLFDNDWNPSADLQAMARIHRDGQERPCMIYRLLTKGALDEKIFQRQATKLSLADSVVDGKNAASSFSRDELRDLFRLDEEERCQTHELLACPCGGSGAEVRRDEVVDPAERVAARVKVLEEKSEADPRQDSAYEDIDDLPDLGQVIRSSQYDDLCKRAEIEEKKLKASRKEREKGKMIALMQYRHFDTARFADGAVGSTPIKIDDSDSDGYQDIDDVKEEKHEPRIEDDVLMHVLKDSEKQIAFVFSKTSQ